MLTDESRKSGFDCSTGLGLEKVVFGRIRVYPNYQMSVFGMCGIRIVGFGRGMKFLVSGIFW